MPQDPETKRLLFSPRDLHAMITKGRHLGLTDRALATELQLTPQELSRIERGTDRRWLNELLAAWQERIHPRTPADNCRHPGKQQSEHPHRSWPHSVDCFHLPTCRIGWRRTAGGDVRRR